MNENLDASDIYNDRWRSIVFYANKQKEAGSSEANRRSKQVQLDKIQDGSEMFSEPTNTSKKLKQVPLDNSFFISLSCPKLVYFAYLSFVFRSKKWWEFIDTDDLNGLRKAEHYLHQQSNHVIKQMYINVVKQNN